MSPGREPGTSLNVEPAAVDALDVLRVAGEAARPRTGGDPAAALALCTTALAMFHGDVLPDAGDGEWVAPHRVRLEEARLGLVRGPARGEARSRRWRARSSPSSKPLVNLHPLREGLWASLITALYRSGRQADALGAYTRVRASLAEQLGLEPGPALRALEHQVLLHDPVLDGTRSCSDRHALVVSHLPVLTSPMTGRDVDLAAVSRRTAHERLVTLVGPAGIGKTRLAVEVATIVERTDGACLVRLEGARNAATVLTAIAEALDVNPRSDISVIDHLRGSDLLARPRQLRAGRRRRRRLRRPA